jgi:hypothetical protein
MMKLLFRLTVSRIAWIGLHRNDHQCEVLHLLDTAGCDVLHWRVAAALAGITSTVYDARP